MRLPLRLPSRLEKLHITSIAEQEERLAVGAVSPLLERDIFRLSVDVDLCHWTLEGTVLVAS
jgi:hypothetical protein